MLISDFARLAQVSVRMLRHYDAIGLLEPAGVDAVTGYRRYAADQLHDVNRIVALKDLGFRLEQIRELLDEDLPASELRGMLRLRRAQLQAEARSVETRLSAVRIRLTMIEQENNVSPDFVVKTIPAVRLIARTALIDPADIAVHVGPMFDAVAGALTGVGADLATPIATYSLTDRGMAVAVGYAAPCAPPAGTEVVDLPEVDAVCGVHLGPMSGIQVSWQRLHRWAAEGGYDFAGPCRELYVRSDSPDQEDWVTELQQPVRAAHDTIEV